MSILRQIFETLREYYAAKPDYPWWSENPKEVILGAILVQGSAWKSVETVLSDLRARGLLDFQKIIQQTDEQFATLIRPVGFHVEKAKRIKAVARLVMEQSGGNLDRYFVRDADVVRKELLSISGIGIGTADNILLYAGQVPIYVVDTLTVRVLVRHGIADLHADERTIQELIHRELAPDEEPYGAKLFQQMQKLLVRLGRDFCDPLVPDCSNCPLNRYLPEGEAKGVPPLPKAVLPTRTTATTQKPAKQPPKALLPKSNETERKKTTHPARARAASPKSVEQTLEPASPARTAELPPDLNETERKIVEVIGESPMPIDDVVTVVQLPVHIVRATIAILQMKKLVCQVEGNQVRRC